MAESDTYSRRDFVQLALLGTGSLCLLPRCAGQPSAWRFFSVEESRVMDAIAEQIIPTDEWPGGRDSGVTNFIDRQLTGPYTRFQTSYRQGITAIQETCQNRFRKKFEDLAWEEQTTFLENMENGTINDPPWKDKSSKEFFNLVRDHSMQAYYGSPRHGGNKRYISYKMLDLDYPHIIGQNRYPV